MKTYVKAWYCTPDNTKFVETKPPVFQKDQSYVQFKEFDFAHPFFICRFVYAT